ncbi:hypothetical protein TWF730_003995 [Orbilia blumenaviensis]|uniref:Uncharacterized protein n=1 Tax=Orbilia blumenaviensis TaxID=1796055 RepID=A0AAV9U5C6_9PEZI
MAHRLRGLDMEGKYMLLSYLPDVDAIEKFCIVFPQFRRVYYVYIDRLKDRGIPHETLSDIKPYVRESVWIAHHRGILNRWSTTKKDVQDSIDQYIAYEELPKEVEISQWRPGESCYDLPVSALQDKMLANHKYILAIYRHLAKYELDKRDAMENGGAVRRRLATPSRHLSKNLLSNFWPTPEEEENIVRALYRLWVLVLMTCEHRRPLDRKLYLGCVMNIWCGSFWENMQVWAVQKILYEMIAAGVGEAVYKDKENKIPKDDLDLGALEADFMSDIASSALLHDFPTLIPRWFQKPESFGCPQKRDEHVRDLRKFFNEETFLELDVPLPNTCILDSHYEFYSARLVSERYIGQAIPFQRVCRRGAILQAMPHRGNILWVQLNDIKNPAESSLDLSVCLWDNWRCKTWGFKNPSFTRANMSLQLIPGSIA